MRKKIPQRWKVVFGHFRIFSLIWLEALFLLSTAEGKLVHLLHMPPMNRRHLIKQSSLLAGSAFAFPNLSLARKTIGPVIIGSGEHQYEVNHRHVQLPDQYHWQVTHNVAVDRDQNLYVMHEGSAKLKDHPAIFVFDPDGKFIRAFGSQFQGGGHGIEVHQEGKEQFLYVTGYQQVKSIAKMTLTGEIIWYLRAPMESGRYTHEEVTRTNRTWGRNRFMPTNVAFHPNGDSFYLADGYGAHCIHRYHINGTYLSTFGKSGKKDGQFNLPHGLWIDDRGDRSPTIAVTDRGNGRMQWFTLDGEHLKTESKPFTLPANVDVYKDLMLIPDLASRLTFIDGNDNIFHIGHDPEWSKQVNAKKKAMRKDPSKWQDGKFIHPHDACFDASGNIFVAEWVSTGRISKLRKL